MFTGIIEEIGTVAGIEFPGGPDADATVRIRGPLVTSDAHPGDSIAVSGVCLTVTTVADGVFEADVMPETLRHTALGSLSVGSHVNLERALQPASRLGGHIVQGHVDGTATLLQREVGPRWQVLTFSLAPDVARLVAHKGSVALDGISLTVSAVDDQTFSVSLIPTTLAATTLGERQVGDDVNIEVDVIAKHVERLLGVQS